MSRRRSRRDEGSVLLLILGGVVVLGLLVGVVVDSARLYLARRSLESLTDGAALAGAQAVDLGSVYEGRADSGAVRLDPGAARSAVARYLDDADAARAVPGFAVTGVDVRDTSITVKARATVRLPFVGPITRGRAVVVVRSASSASELRAP